MFQMPSLQSCPPSSSRVHGLCGRGASRFWNRFEHGRSCSRLCEKLAIHGCSSPFSKGVGMGQFAREQLQRNVVVWGLEKASDDLDTTNFFLEELIEAKSTLEKLTEAENSMASFRPWQDEGTSQQKDDQDIDKSPEGIWQRSKSSGLGKLPLESNGPPMVILQHYLKADNSPGQPKEKLPRLPLPMPHKKRPAGLPRPSLRRRLGIPYTR